MPDWRIALSDLNYDHRETEAVAEVLRRGWISMGPEVAAFEAEFAAFQKSGHAIAVANGTAALHLALAVLDLQPGDEVIQPALNFVASANMTAAVGARPIFADIIGTGNPTIDPTSIEALITPRTKAVIVMHYGGYLCRMPEIAAICADRGLWLVEDACHAPGAVDHEGTMAGSIGDIGTFSFFSNKNLATGEGGMIVTRHADFAERLRRLRSHGMTSLSWDRHQGHAKTYDVVAHGYNYRLDDLHAALGREQLKKLVAGNQRRRELSEMYRALIAPHPDLTLPFVSDPATASAYHLMPVVAASAQIREQAVTRLKEQRIQTSFHYPCITTFEAFAADKLAHVPRSLDFSSRVMTLPLHPRLQNQDVEDVCAALLCGS